jgi:hypothetical protein
MRFDVSAIALIAANLVTIAVAVVQRWPLADLLWVYWGQSCIIGFFNFLRILGLRRFSTEHVRYNDEPVDATHQTKVHLACFFAFHYGFFHYGYFVFLSWEVGAPVGGGLWLAACLGTFLVNHGFSFVHNFRRDRTRCPNIGTVMMFPYARIVPMHVMALAGGFLVRGTFGLMLFLVLKTGADLVMHAIEHAEGK